MIDFKGFLYDNLPLIEFTYNNNYHFSIQIAPYDDLYWRRCRSHVGWFKDGATVLIGPDILLYATDKEQLLRDRLKTT